MTEHLRKPPIVEAILDIQVEPPVAVTAADLERLHAPISADYSEKQAQHLWQTQTKFEDGQPQTSTQELGMQGYLFRSTDKKQVVQFLRDRFAFSRLEPYESWDAMAAESKRLWGIYVAALRPERVNRLAIRTINRIQTSSRSVSLADYFTAPPATAPGLPEGIEHYLSRVVIPYPADNLRAVVTTTFQMPPDSPWSEILFDIDVFASVGIDGGDPALWTVFEKIHRIKNDIFFSSLKKEALEPFR